MTFITYNWRLKLLSVFLASTTWVAVAYASNPPGSVTRQVSVETGPPPVGLVPLAAPPQVNVTVAGLQSSINNFKRESLHALVDLTSARKGHNVLHVRVDNTDRNVTVRNVQPSTIDLVLDKVTTASRKVDVRFTGSPSSCCVAKGAVATPDTVTLTGPESLLPRAVPFVIVDVTDRVADVQSTLAVRIEVPNQKEAQITANPAQVSVVVPIERIKNRALLPLVCCEFSGLPTGYRVVRIDVSPSSVLVEGNQDALTSLTAVDAETIDLSGVTSDVIRTITLQVKNGVTVLTKGPFTAHFFIQAQPGVSPGPSPSPSPSPSP